jgi:hypothetical protein
MLTTGCTRTRAGEQRDRDRPLTIHVYECGCPAGRFTASIPRLELRVLDDDPAEAAAQVVRHALLLQPSKP